MCVAAPARAGHARRNESPGRGRGAEIQHARVPFLLAARCACAPWVQNVSQSSSDLLLDAVATGAGAAFAAGLGVPEAPPAIGDGFAAGNALAAGAA